MNTNQLSSAVRAEARQLGFDLVGICAAVEPPGLSRFREWLEAGYAGEMHYLPNRAKAYEHPRSVLDGARSIVMLAMNYNTVPPHVAEPGQGRVSRYAWGSVDYHDLIHDRLQQLAERVHQWAPTAKVRGVVDSAPLLEREFAQLAGLGWIGKNTLLLNRSLGSWFFLAALLTDLELELDTATETDHCGTCRACLDACPTQAFPAPYVLDATRCISYLTIELRGTIPEVLRESMGDWLFGCDICQDVCPWNRKAPLTNEIAFQPCEDLPPAELRQLFWLTEEDFRKRFRHTPMWRSKRRGMLRNAAIVLGNQCSADAVDALCHGLRDHEPLIRASAAWALGRINSPACRMALEQRLGFEPDEEVRAAIADAICSQSQTCVEPPVATPDSAGLG